MRNITSHIVNPVNDKLVIEVCDEPGSGGANHRYDVTGFDTENNPSSVSSQGYKTSFGRLPVIFQNGPIADVGVNGVTHEVLLAIICDRLEGFQRGPYACEDNAAALAYIRLGMVTLQQRTKERMARGVEGTHKV